MNGLSTVVSNLSQYIDSVVRIVGILALNRFHITWTGKRDVTLKLDGELLHAVWIRWRWWR
jgi:hypothetical protein